LVKRSTNACPGTSSQTQLAAIDQPTWPNDPPSAIVISPLLLCSSPWPLNVAVEQSPLRHDPQVGARGAKLIVLPSTSDGAAMSMFASLTFNSRQRSSATSDSREIRAECPTVHLAVHLPGGLGVGKIDGELLKAPPPELMTP
jgi:hypothetical protein